MTTEEKKVLIVDDDAAILDSLKLILEFEGYQVKTMTKGSEVFSLQPPNYPDIIFLDMWLSGEDGRDICRAIKADDKLSRIPVVIVSASHALENSATEAGADAFIPKPFDIADLISVVKKLT